jgi:hypothetical protein
MARIVKTVRIVRTVKTVKTVRIVKHSARPQGVILYRGPSMLNGRPIIAVATGLGRKSKNAKTGAMIPVYILADESVDPTTAVKTGQDDSVCGDCPHRSKEHATGTIQRGEVGKIGSCYVNTAQGPLAIFRAVQAGSYPRYNPVRHNRLFRSRMVRFGAYGDPAALPIAILETMAKLSSGWTGYTHQWRKCDSSYARFLMASVETPNQRLEAKAKGYRTFRVRLASQPIERGEFVCPASAEAGKRLECSTCGACDGAKASPRAVDPVIIFHGSEIGGNWKGKIYEETMARVTAEEARRFPLAMAN